MEKPNSYFYSYELNDKNQIHIFILMN
jgi:hypothetical protein